MMDRFNFFDIYGYLIPGGFGVALLWLPLLLRSGVPAELPTTEITIVGLVAAYIAGHLLYGMARNLLPTAGYHVTKDNKPEQDSGPKTLSYCLLAAADEQFEPSPMRLSSSVRAKLKAAVQKRFGIDIDDRDQRGDVFYLCRAALTQGKVGAYVEQYQGLNALSRGLATACVFAVAYYVGWILAAPFTAPPSPSGGAPAERFSAVVAVLLALGLLAPLLVVLRAPSVRPANNGVQWLEKQGWFPGVASVLLLGALGFLAGCWHPLASVRVYQLAVIAAVLWVAYRRFEIAAQVFGDDFVEAVFREFVVFAGAPGADPAADG